MEWGNAWSCRAAAHITNLSYITRKFYLTDHIDLQGEWTQTTVGKTFILPGEVSDIRFGIKLLFVWRIENINFVCSYGVNYNFKTILCDELPDLWPMNCIETYDEICSTEWYNIFWKIKLVIYVYKALFLIFILFCMVIYGQCYPSPYIWTD